MKYIDEFRKPLLVKKIALQIQEVVPEQTLKIMEVCGTHTQSFFRFGLNKLLPKNIQLISGPGCPVCVSSQEYIDRAISLAQDRQNIIVTFGDILRVPGSNSSLEEERSRRGDVKVVYSSFESLRVAQDNPGKKIIFLAVGFETTAPTIALSILAAAKGKLKNLFFFSALKLIPPAMEYLMQDKEISLQGFLCPGHVSAIIGSSSYEFIARKYRIPCCVAGFEPLDILQGIYFILKQIKEKKPKISNQYQRVVTKEGNLRAQKIIQQVFQANTADWRGLGKIPLSGLKIRKEYSCFDAEKHFNLHYRLPITDYRLRKCKCGQVLKGIISPPQCPLFMRSCRPENPFGPCMVASEGACNAYYKYKK